MINYLLGVATPIVLVLLVIGVVLLTETGETIQCRTCGYSTGPMRTTMRITKVIRWQWHKQVIRRTRRHPT